MGIKVGYKDGFIEFNQPDKSEDNWVVIKSESVVFDKKALILAKFTEDFPNLPISGVDDDVRFDVLTRLCSRTRALSRWYAQASLLYSDLTQMPAYLEGQVAPSDYAGIKDKILILNRKIAKDAEARRELARDYERKLKKLEEDAEIETAKIIGNDKVFEIITLTSEAMPSSLQLAIESYTPSDKSLEIGESRKKYAREMLIQFKVKLLQLIKADPTINIKRLIDEISLK